MLLLRMKPRLSLALLTVVAAEILGPGSARGEPSRLVLATGTETALAQVRGLRVGSCRRGICTAEIWPEEIDLAGLQRAAPFIEHGVRRRPLLDRSLPQAGVTEALRQDTGLDGEGTLVIVIDSGLDWRHQDFADDQGVPRVEWLMDLSSPPTGLYPEREDRLGGALWSRRELEAHLEAEAAGLTPSSPVLQRDVYGHGTHVASIAAGARGVAPAASLIAARAARDDWPPWFEDADIIETARLAFELADTLDRPAVLLLALGGHDGPHDGTSLLELALTDLVGPDHPGCAVVVAAGNSGGSTDHASGWLDGSSTSEIVLEVRREDESLAVDLAFWSPVDSDLSFSLVTPSGGTLEPVVTGDARSRTLDDAFARLDNASTGVDPRNDTLEAMLELRPRLDGPIGAGQYRVVIRGRGRFDAYLSWTSDAWLHGGARLLTGLTPDGSITVPATAQELISVGASVSRRSWVDVAGRSWRHDRYVLGELAPYSSAGPTRTGGLAPTLVAPGHVVAAAMGHDAEAGTPGSVFTPASSLTPTRAQVVPPGDRAVLWGTSMAAPHAAGVVALLFQLDPSLTQDELRALLSASARTADGAAGRAWSPRWGFGELDAAAAVRLLTEGFARGEVDPARSAAGAVHDLLAPDRCTTLTVIPKNSEGHPLGPGATVEIEPSAGPAPRRPQANEFGIYSSRWCTGSAPLGRPVRFLITVDGQLLDQRPVVFVAPSRARIAGWADARGASCHSLPLPNRFPQWFRLLRF